MNSENLDEIENLAELQFSKKEIQIILDIHLDTEKEKTAYLRGRLKAQAEVRKAIFTQAKQGSTPAQTQFIKLMEQSR